MIKFQIHLWDIMKTIFWGSFMKTWLKLWFPQCSQAKMFMTYITRWTNDDNNDNKQRLITNAHPMHPAFRWAKDYTWITSHTMPNETCYLLSICKSTTLYKYWCIFKVPFQNLSATVLKGSTNMQVSFQRAKGNKSREKHKSTLHPI